VRTLVALFFAALLVCGTPALAQFNNGNVVTSAAGTANAQTGTVTNAQSYADLTSVILTYVPAATNTGAATLTLNSFGSAVNFRKPNGSGATALTGSELVTGQAYAIEYDGTSSTCCFQILGNVQLPVSAQNLGNSSLAFTVPTNLQINGSVTSNALTIAVQGNNGSNASATNPITVAFRDATIANGDPVIEQVTGALSLTISSTNTMGCRNGIMCRLWVFLANNAGTVALCAYNANSGGTSIVGINEAALQSSASGTTGGSSAQTLYCSTSSLSSVAVRYIGYIDIQETTAGTWSSGPTYTQLFGPGIKRPSEVIQRIYATTTTNTSVASSTYTATTSAVSITPTAAANLMYVYAKGSATVGASGSIAFEIRRGTSTAISGIDAINNVASGAALNGQYAQDGLDQPNTTSSTTYTVYLSATAVSGSYVSTGSTATITVDEIQD
jgi:hypothetical protein